MGESGSLIPCLSQNSLTEHSICIILRVSCSGDYGPALPGERSEGLSFQIYCINASLVSVEQPLERGLAADVVKETCRNAVTITKYNSHLKCLSPHQSAFQIYYLIKSIQELREVGSSPAPVLQGERICRAQVLQGHVLSLHLWSSAWASQRIQILRRCPGGRQWRWGYVH